MQKKMQACKTPNSDEARETFSKIRKTLSISEVTPFSWQKLNQTQFSIFLLHIFSTGPRRTGWSNRNAVIHRYEGGIQPVYARHETNVRVWRPLTLTRSNNFATCNLKHHWLSFSTSRAETVLTEGRAPVLTNSLRGKANWRTRKLKTNTALWPMCVSPVCNRFIQTLQFFFPN